MLCAGDVLPHALEMGRHRGQVNTGLAVLLASVTFVAGVLATWGVEKGADKVLDAALDDGPLAVDTDGKYAQQVVVPSGTIGMLPNPYGRAIQAELPRLAQAAGGAAVSPDLYFVTYGLADTPVIIRQIVADAVACKDVHADEWAGAMLDVGGALPGLNMAIGLTDLADTAAGLPEPSAEVGGPWTFPRQVSGAEADEFVITVDAPPKSICNFLLRFDYTSNGKDGHVVVTDSGRPFQVAADDLVSGGDYVHLSPMPE